MGRKLQGAKLRASKRGKIAALELVDTTADRAETQHVTDKKDDELFVLDTTAILPSKKQLIKKEKKIKHKYESSAKEQVQIQKLVDAHSPTALQGLAKTFSSTAKHAKRKGSVKPTFDLWGDEVVVAAGASAIVKTKKVILPGFDSIIGSTVKGIKPHEHVKIVTTRALAATGKAVNIDLAKSGQSYNPDRVEHKKVLHEAIQVEEKRQTAEILSKAPISKGMTEETKAFLLGDSDTDESDDGGAEEEGTEEEQSIQRHQMKLTRAQRNKQKRVRAEQREIDERKRNKKIQNSVAESKTVSKLLKKKEAADKERKEEIQKLKEAAQRTKGINVYTQMAEDNPMHAPTYPVALSSDLSGSLRTLKPKGSLITDRMTSFSDRGMAPKKAAKRKRRVEGKRRTNKLRVRGKGHAASKEGAILG